MNKRKLIIIFLASVIFGFCLAKICHAEIYYRMSKKDYFALCAEISGYITDRKTGVSSELDIRAGALNRIKLTHGKSSYK